MNNAIFAACGALTLAGTITIAAQTPTQTPTTTRPQPPNPTQTAPKGDQTTLTLTGCLTAGDSTMGAATADATTKPGATPANTRFVLANVEMDRPAVASGTTPAPAQTPGTPTGASAHPQPSEYTVLAGSGVNLAAHLNHRVKVTGTIDNAHAGMPGMTPADKPTAKPGEVPPSRPGDAPKASPMGMDKASAGKAGPTLTVSSVTMISASCTSTR